MGMPRRLMLVFAIACGLVAANLYYAQPMLETIARQFHASSATVGQIVTLSQLGFAVGLFFLVPLGDLLDRRRLIAATLTLAVAALIAMALAPALPVLLGAALVIGLTSVVAQILVPFAATLANDANRGRVVGFVMSGLLLGILLSRTVAGLVNQVAGWRAVYGGAAVLIAAADRRPLARATRCGAARQRHELRAAAALGLRHRARGATAPAPRGLWRPGVRLLQRAVDEHRLPAGAATV